MSTHIYRIEASTVSSGGPRTVRGRLRHCGTTARPRLRAEGALCLRILAEPVSNFLHLAPNFLYLLGEQVIVGSTTIVCSRAALTPQQNGGSKTGAVAIIHIGAPAAGKRHNFDHAKHRKFAGMNAATHAFVRSALSLGYDVWGVHESLRGLKEGVFEVTQTYGI